MSNNDECRELSFQEKFHATVVALRKKPLEYRLGLLVRTGAITEDDRAKALRKAKKIKKS